MKKLLSILLILLLCAPALGEQAPVYARCTAQSLNVRAGAGMDNARVGSLSRGDIVIIVGTSGDWARVTDINGAELGWVHSDYVEPIELSQLPVDVFKLPGVEIPIGRAACDGGAVYVSPDSRAAKIGEIEPIINLSVLLIIGDYAMVNFAGGYGWVARDKLDITYVSALDLGDGFCYCEFSDELRERTYGLSYKENCSVPYADLRYLNVRYVDFEGEIHEGELVVNVMVAKEMLIVMRELFNQGYAFTEIALVDDYGADDRASMTANNTSAFNFRNTGEGRLSKHAFGVAIDINPLINPYVDDDIDYFSPPNAGEYVDRRRDFPGKIDETDPAYLLLTGFGWFWGGHWNSYQDYQHFEKDIYWQ